MNLFDLFKEKTDFEKNQELIKNSKKELIKVLQSKGLHENEIAQVTQIIDDAQNKIQRIKDKLIGTNIITDTEKDKNPKEILDNAQKQIDIILQNMTIAIPQKVQYILENRFISEE